MTQASTIARGSFWTLSSNITTKLISFIYTIIIARLLLVEEIGIFYLVLSVLGILYVFTDLGIMYSLSRYVPYLYGKKEFGKLKNLVKLSYLGGGILTFIFSVLVFIFSDYISQLIGQPVIAPILKMMSIWLFIKEIDDVNRGILKGRKRMKEAQGIGIIQSFVKLTITIIAFYMIGFNAEALSIGYLLSFLLVLPLGGYCVIQEIKTWKNEETKYTFKEQLSFGREIISFGLIVTLISTLWTIIQYTDRIMLGFFTDDALDKIAIYSIALGLANLVIIFGGIGGIFFPVVSELYGKKDFESMNRTLKTSMKWLVMLMVPFTLIMGIFGDALLELFYGAVYEKGATILLLFVIGLFIRSIFSLPSLILSAMRRLDVEVKAMGVAAIANVALNLFFIPIWGINGAALASLISLIVLSGLIFYYSKKIFNFSFPKETYKPLVAGLVALVIIFLLKEPIISLMDNYVLEMPQGQLLNELVQKMIKFVMFGLLFLLSVFIYFVALLMLKSFGEEEILLLEAGLKKAKVPESYILFIRKFLEGKWLKIPFLR